MPINRLPTLIVSVVAVANILVFALAGYSIEINKKQYELRAEVLSKNVASAIDQSVKSSVEKIDLALHATTDELERQLSGSGIHSAEMIDFLSRNEQRLPEVENFRVTNEVGKIILSSKPFVAGSINVSDRDYFTHFRDGPDQGMYMSSPMLGRVLKKPLIPLVRRYNYRDGRFAGVVYATVSVEHLGELLKEFDVGPQGSLILRDLHLGLIARSPPISDTEAGQIGNTLVSPELRQHAESEEPSATFLNSLGGDGIHRIVTFRRMGRVPMIIIAGVASSDYLEGWWHEVYLTSAMALGFLVLSVVFATLQMRSFARYRSMQLANEIAFQRLKKIASRVPGVVYQYLLRPDGSSCFPFASDAIRDVYRVNPEDVRIDASKVFGVLHPDDHESVVSSIQHSATELSPWRHEYRVKFSDGVVRWLLGNALPEREGNGNILWHGFITDITDLKKSAGKLQQAAAVFTYAREAIMITDAFGTIVDVNAAFTRITGYRREEVIGQNPRILSSGRQDAAFYQAMWDALINEGHWSGEIWNRRKDGGIYAVLLTISAISDTQGSTQQYVALFSDISAMKEYQSQLELIAHYDALTNLPGRLLLVDRLKQAMAQAIRRDKQVAIVYIDIDGFKDVNDRHGHEVGDRLLSHLATAMKVALREADTIARLGGDEFVAILIDLDGFDSSVLMINRLLAAASTPMYIGNTVLQCSASIGVTFFPQQQEVFSDQLLRQADQAMYGAKLAGKNRIHFFDAEHDDTLRRHHETLERVYLAKARGEFVLYFQPIVDMHNGLIVGVEALIRWLHPDKGVLAPSTFLPIIEDSPLAVEVGEWVIDAALSQLEIWHASGFNWTVSVNISARQLQAEDFLARLQTILERHPHVNPGYLQLEVLETSALAEMDQVSKVIGECHKWGVKFALDDFGTGYSSLSYLKRLHATTLKIDQSFVHDLINDHGDLAIIRGIMGLATAFESTVIAEGVETLAQARALLDLGCRLAQGYEIARPMPAEQLLDWANAWLRDEAWRVFSCATSETASDS